MEPTLRTNANDALSTLPGDEARRVMWRFQDRPDLQALVQSARGVARGPVATLVAQGGRHTQEWTAEKRALFDAFDAAGITTASLDQGGPVAGPKNLVLALVAFELAWVDAGAASSAQAHHVAVAAVHERGTDEQRRHIMAATGGPGGRPLRGAFCVTEPLPHAGAETGLLSGKVRVAEWREGEEPILQVDKRGRFITNMGFADFVAVAVDTGDPRIASSCLVIVEQGDPGLFHRGDPTLKLVQQLSSTRDPVFSLRVPASRIVGGYTVTHGTLVPRFTHPEILRAVFRGARVTVGAMTAAKLLSAVEPVLRYQRERFRGAESVEPGTPAYDIGLQQREDVLHRLIDVWAAGEAAASLAFAAARLLDELDALERRKTEVLAAQGAAGGPAHAIAYLTESIKPEGMRDEDVLQRYAEDDLVRFLIADAAASVLSPATKLWNTGHGATMMREAVGLMGGYGITEGCPGFLGQKWMDAQLEATIQGTEADQRRQLTATMADEVFLAQFEIWISEMRHVAARRPGTGACALASAMELWLWTIQHLQLATDAAGRSLYAGGRQGVTFPLADALCWLLAVRAQILDVVELEAEGPGDPALSVGLPGLVLFLSDLCHVQAARTAGEVGRITAELVFGYGRHPQWDAAGCAGCFGAEDLEALESIVPGIESTAGAFSDVIALDGSHRPKAGPCVRIPGLDDFLRLRRRMDGCLAGSRLAKDRAAAALTRVTLPAALDYPA